MNKFLIFVVIAALVIGGVFLIRSHQAGPIVSPSPSVSITMTHTPTPTPTKTPLHTPTPTPVHTPTPSPTPGIIVHEAQMFSVSIANSAYVPASLTVKRGDAVKFTNNDSMMHTVTAGDGSFNSGSIDPSGQWILATANLAPGTYEYSCSFHPAMHGTIIVQ